MQRIRLAASGLMALIILALATLLFKPSFALPTGGAEVGLGGGALPQFCVIAGAILAAASFIRDVVVMIRTDSIVGSVEISEPTEPRRIVLVGIAAFALLVAYVITWLLLGFLIASIMFLAAMSFLLLPRGSWNPRTILLLLANSVFFGVGVWALFIYVLQVPLR